jgi:hypothetical protein
MMRENRTDVLHASRFDFESQIPGGILYRERAARCHARGWPRLGARTGKKRPGREPRRKEENN